MTITKILVVIPTLNEKAHIEKCLRSLCSGADDKHPFDIVVSDGASTDGTQTIVENLMSELPGLKLVHNAQQIQSAGINFAVQQCARADHRVLVRCDAHAVYPPNFVADLVDTLDRTDAQSVVISMDSRGNTAFGRAAAWIADTRLGAGGSAHRGGHKSGFVDHGHHAAFDLAWFRKAGGYDASFSHNEDAELDFRLTSMGAKIWMESTIRIDYVMRPNLASLARQYWNYGRGRCRTVCKHNMRLKLRQAIPILNFLGIILCLCLSDLSAAFLILPLAYFGTLAVCSPFAAFSMQRLGGLWAGPALFVMHNAWAVGFIRSWLSHTKDQRKVFRSVRKYPTPDGTQPPQHRAVASR